MITASRRLSRKKDAKKIIIMQKIAGARGAVLVTIRLNRILDQLSKVIICRTAMKD